VGIWGREPSVHSPSRVTSVPLPAFRRLTKAHAELVTYIDGWESERPSTASAAASDAMTRRAGLRSAFARARPNGIGESPHRAADR
jgi:hypothetical protein